MKNKFGLKTWLHYFVTWFGTFKTLLFCINREEVNADIMAFNPKAEAWCLSRVFPQIPQLSLMGLALSIREGLLHGSHWYYIPVRLPLFLIYLFHSSILCYSLKDSHISISNCTYSLKLTYCFLWWISFHVISTLWGFALFLSFYF